MQCTVARGVASTFNGGFPFPSFFNRQPSRSACGGVNIVMVPYRTMPHSVFLTKTVNRGSKIRDCLALSFTGSPLITSKAMGDSKAADFQQTGRTPPLCERALAASNLKLHEQVLLKVDNKATTKRQCHFWCCSRNLVSYTVNW